VNVLVGIDVQAIDEVETSVRLFGDRYTRRLFTEHEVHCCGENPLTAASGLAARFAAKEAVLKILDTREAAPSWKTIEVRRGEGGRPEIVLSGETAELARRQGVSAISLSLSHGGGIATAAVVAQVSPPLGEMNQ
jgi:holo-[acyl-carrier protein] synthase